MAIVENIKVIHWGLGAMGSGMAKHLLTKQGIEIVGGIIKNEKQEGMDLGEYLGLERKIGVSVTNEVEKLLQDKQADVVIIAIDSFTRNVFPAIKMAVEAGKNVITIAEEMAAPQAQEPKLAAEIDRLAKLHGVTVLGTGINPGFVLDALIIMLTGACLDVKKIKAARVNDLSPFGPTVMRTQGVGSTVEEFQRGLASGEIVGHIGFQESVYMIAKALGWELDEIKETREPIISNTYRETPYVKVEPGMVAGCKHIAYGLKNGEAIITLEHPQQILPEKEGVNTGDFIWIEGTPDICINDKPEIPGGIGTMAVATNMIPHVIKASPGLVTMRDLPLPSAYMGDWRELLK